MGGTKQALTPRKKAAKKAPKTLQKFFGPESFWDIARDIAGLVAKKNQKYGDAFGKGGSFIRLLWPKGIPVEAYDDMLAFIRIFDKMMRVATDPGAFGEDPHGDMHGYTLLNLRRKRHSTRLRKMVGK